MVLRSAFRSRLGFLWTCSIKDPLWRTDELGNLDSKGHASLQMNFISLKFIYFFDVAFPMAAFGAWFTLHRGKGCEFEIGQLSA